MDKKSNTNIGMAAKASPKWEKTAEEERVIIEAKYEEMIASIRTNLSDQDMLDLRKAFDISLEAHSAQRRKSGEPYILHPLAVAQICAEEIGLGPTAIVAALLHDTVEDTDITLEFVEEHFGAKIRLIVDGLTKLYSVVSDSPQAENFKKILSTLTEDVRVVLIKIADRLHNMRTIGAMKEASRLKIASETIYMYAPLAHRLGLYNIKTEFQDLVMKVMDHDNYKFVAKKLNETKRERNKYINTFINELTPKLDELDIEYEIIGRPKSISSIWNKINTKKIPFEEIYDLFAIRIIIDVDLDMEKMYCWNVYSVITDVYKPIPERLKDWVNAPKANGYESLHTTVVGPKGEFVEVQIRSRRMNEVAEKGFAAHWKYKGVKGQEDTFEVWLNGVREALENYTGNAVEFVNDFKSNLFREEVYVYTPKGDLVMMAKGATALDFAFQVHSEVGYHCIATKVNNRLVPLSHVLENGDKITVTTSKNQKPNENWLKMVVTGKAKSKIRSSMKEEKRKIGEIARETLLRKFSQLKVDFEENVDLVVKYCGFNNRPDLYVAIAEETIQTSVLKNFLVQNGKLVLIETEKKPAPKENPVKRLVEKDEKFLPKLVINGQSADDFKYEMATCCNPVNGDEVFGYLAASTALKIHRYTCPNATDLLANYGYRVMKAEWVSSFSTSFVVELKVTGIDGKGVVQRFTNIITNELKINMRSISMSAQDGYFEGLVKLIVFNTDQLNFTIRTLQKIEGINSVVRIS